MSLPKDAQDYLDQLRVKEPAELNESQLAFLKARSEYLTADEAQKFGIGEAKPAKAKSSKAKASDE